MMRRTQQTAATDIVAAVQEQTAQAAALAGIAGQERLADPRLNPAVRTHADALRDVQQRKVLEAEHARLLRRYRVADRRAEDAERTLEVIQAARQAISPARSVLALHTGRRRFLGVSMGASLTLSAGSAVGVAHLAAVLGAPSAVGYIAEVGLTGLSTMAILYRSHIAENHGRLEGWQNRSLWALTVVPLLASIVANLVSVGAVGVFCSIGAAAFSLLSAVITDRSAATLRSQAAKVTTSEVTDLQAAAMGDGFGGDLIAAHQATPPNADQEAVTAPPALAVEAGQDDRPPLVVVDPVADEATTGVRELAAWLAKRGPDEPGGGGVAPEPTPGPGDGSPHGAACDLEGQGGHIDAAGGHIDSGQPEDPAARILPAAEARRAVGASTRHRIARYLAEHPGATHARIAQDLELSEATVKRHRRGLRTGEG